MVINMNVIYDPIETDIYYRHKDIHTSPFPHYHKHDAYEIFLLLNGDACYYIEQSCYHISRGSMLVIQPGEYHRITLITLMSTTGYPLISSRIYSTSIPLPGLSFQPAFPIGLSDSKI